MDDMALLDNHAVVGVGGAVVGVSDILFTVLIVQFPMTSLREIRILQLLNHENIMPLVEICRAKGMSDP